MSPEKRIHLDHNATTPLRAEARDVLLEVLDMGLGNASSVHASGRRARAVVDDARERVALALGVEEDEIIFTSGGTESNNLALFGVLQAGPVGMQLVTTSLEHAAVLEPAARLKSEGIAVIRVGNDGQGHIDVAAIARAAAAGPTLISAMAANNEIGSTTDLAALRSAVGRRAGLLVHTDAVQLLGKRPLDGLWDAVDLASFSAHKVGGPAGVGVLVRRGGAPLNPRLYGGAQEAELRPGTENVAAIAAAARAIELAVAETDAYRQRVGALTEELWTKLQRAVPDARLNGPRIDDPTRLPNTLNVSVPRMGDARMLVAKLDLEGLEVSAGSACASGSLEPSHVLQALGHGIERATSGLRLSLGRTTDVDDVCIAVERLRITLGEAP